MPSLVISVRKLRLALAIPVLLSGCGDSSVPTAHLTGVVTIQGAPVPPDAKAAISFTPTGGGEPVSVPIVDGRYDSPKTPQGSISVKFYISRPVGPEKISERTGEKYQEFANLVPPEYSAGMVLEVNGDDSNQNFEL